MKKASLIALVILWLCCVGLLTAQMVKTIWLVVGATLWRRLLS